MKKLNTFQKIVSIVLLVALIIRIIYVVKIPYFQRQHDVEPNGNGLSYIFSIYNEGKLPEDNWGQHYHPPLHQIIAAGWLKIVNIFTSDIVSMCESLQYLTVIYSMGLIYVVYKITEKLNFENKYKLFILMIMAFHPTFIVLSGSINNDGLCLLLSMLSIYRLMIWYEDTCIKNTTILAIVIGLAVMTKISAALIAIPTIFVFLLKMIIEIKNTDKKKMMFEKYFYLYVFFGCISLPIGLWYAIRNYKLFNQPLIYVMDIHNMDLFAGDQSIFRRLIPFSNEIFKMYCNMLQDKNISIFLIKNSLFGEYTWGNGSILNICYWIAIITNIIMIITGIYMVIRNSIRKDKENVVWKIFFMILIIFNIMSYITMNKNLPYTCSMDFRYMFPVLISGCLFTAFELSNLKKNEFKYEKVLFSFICICNILLMVSSDIIILFSKIV